MKNLTYEDFLNDPEEVMHRVRSEANRGRAQAMHNHLLMPLARFCGRLLAIPGVKARLDPRVAARLAA